MKKVSLKVYQYSKWALVVFLIIVALMSVTGRTLLSNVEYFKNAIEQELADYGIKGVKLENIEGSWQGLQPMIIIRGASLSIPGRSNALFVNELSVRVKLVASLLSGDLILESFHSSIEKLILVRDEKGAWWLNDIALTARNSGDAELDVYGFFQRLPSFVNIDIGLIQLRDLHHGVDYLIQNSKLSSSRKKQQLSLEFLSQLPSTLGRKVQVFLSGDAINQQMFVKAERLNLAQIFQLTSIQKIPLKKAIVSMQSWVTLERFHIKKLVNEASVSQLNFKNNRVVRQNVNFLIRQKAISAPDHWRINTQIKNITKGNKSHTDINSQLLISKQGRKPQLWIDRVNVSFFKNLLQDVLTDETMVNLLAGMQPDARVDNVVAELDIINPSESIFGLEFSDLSTVNYKSTPAVSGLSGALISRSGISQLDIDASRVSLDFGKLFKAPIKLDKLKALAFARVIDSSLMVNVEQFSAANSDIQLQGRLSLDAPATGKPFISLRANYKQGQVTAIPRYLPLKIMHKNVVKWLDNSLRGGTIPQGEFLFHGRLESPAHFTKNQSGVMHAAFTVSDPQVNYLADWPDVRQGEGKLDFINAGMDANFSNVKFAESTVEKVNVSIPDFLKANLFITTNTQTPAKELIGTLSSLPVINVFDEVKQKTENASGLIRSKVKLDIPLSSKLKKKTRVTASADFSQVTISIPEWMIDFKELRGRISIDNEKVTGKGISGKYYGDEVQLDINPDVIKQRTKFAMTGDIHSQSLLTLTPPYLQQPVTGSSPWEIFVSVGHNPGKDSPILEMSANSTLQGTQLDFPEPVNFTDVEKSVLEFKASLLEQGGFSFDVVLNEKIKASGYLDLAEESGNHLRWLNMVLGPGNSVNSKSGITIAGKTESIDLDDWFDFQDKFFPEEDTGAPPFLQQLNSLKLEIENLTLSGQQALNSTVSIENNGEFLQGSIDSELTSGSFQIPYRMSVVKPIKADMDYIRLKKSTNKDKFNVNITDMPNLFIKSREVSYQDMSFTDLTLSTRNESTNFVIEQLDFSRDKVRLKSSGNWQFNDQTGEHVSVFNIDIKGSNFGQTVNNLGLGESIKGSKVVFNGQIGWGGELYSINWPTLIGEVELQLKDGYLMNVEPGAGRFVGLLSFNALPKRLFLDFGDVVKEGMQFNKIQGKFTIKGEVMETQNASMDSVSAKVKIKGETNLRYQTYDQTMIIIPKIGDTLPLLGTLAAGNTVGWGLLLLQKIFKKPIEKSVEIEYKVTGSWDKPEVKLVSKVKPEPENDSFNAEDF